VASYEFESRNRARVAKQLATRILVLALLLCGIAIMAVPDGATRADRLDGAGIVFVALWWYANLLKVDFDMSELLVPPPQVKAGVEFLGASAICFFLAWFV